MPAIRLRPANQDDIDLLLRYRNDTQTRAASRNQEPVDKHEHSQWLSQTLMRKDRRLIIGEIDGLPVGTARLDIREDQSIEVSWTVAPEMRGQGIGHQLVKQVVSELSGKIVACIRRDNLASQKIALATGFQLAETGLTSEKNDAILRYELHSAETQPGKNVPPA